MRDANLLITKALPNGAAAVTSDAIDTGKSSTHDTQVGTVEFLLTAPALVVGDLANGDTIKYDIIWGDSADLTSSPTTYITSALVQTGAGGAGAAAATFRFRVPTSAKRYIGFKATNSGAGDASDKSATLELLPA